ncbi:peroxiredoxin family protein [Paenibacillus aceti]|nr:redoxin domain-containing protein [Paenibacillus aceti]
MKEAMVLPNLQIGTFVLNMELLIYLIAGIVGVLSVRYRERGRLERERRMSGAWNAVFIWIIVWKASLILFDFQGVIRHPQSLLFFSGGIRGVWLASIVVLAYLFLREVRRAGSREAMMNAVTWGAGMAAAAFLLFLLLDDAAGIADYAGLSVAVTLLAFMLSPSLKAAVRSLATALIIGMIGFTILNYSSSGKNVQLDQAAPDFELTDLDGNAVRLSNYRGSTVVLNFWATWCRVCQAEMPHMEKFYREQGGEDVTILSVNATRQERNANLVGEYADKEGLTFPIVLDKSGEVLKEYSVTAYPTTYIIDSSGMIRERYLGAISYEGIKKTAKLTD